MLVIGNRKFRNLQEQVGYNTEQIDEIIKVLDGLNVQDNVVVISDISTDLTLKEIAVVKQPVAFLIYNGSLYIKKNEDSDNAYFDIVFTIAGSTVISFSTSQISVYLATGALSITNSTVSTYSVTQIDTLLSAKANLTGANFTGNITAPSIIENMSGYSFEKIDKANLTNEPIYAGAVKNGNKLTIVYYTNLTRTGDVAGNIANLGRFLIPADILINLIPDENEWLARSNFWASSGANAGVNSTWLVEKVAGGIYFRATKLDDLVLNTKYLCRFEITFLLSENLAS